ncbi:MAG: hypothetical protein ACREX9_14805 [Gammaproteobacteria bacterium]
MNNQVTTPSTRNASPLRGLTHPFVAVDRQDEMAHEIIQRCDAVATVDAKRGKRHGLVIVSNVAM